METRSDSQSSAREHLDQTARWTAAARAIESGRDDRLIDDPWAAPLAGDAGLEWAGSRPYEALVPIILRTRFFDDFIQNTLASVPIDQIVLGAVGLDTRTFRLPWPEGATVFEIDRQEVLQRKDHVLTLLGAAPRCARVVVDAETTGDWPSQLKRFGFDPGRPSLWIIEGLFFYTPSDEILDTLKNITELTVPGSVLGYDVINGAMLTSPFTRPWIEMQGAAGAPWVGTLEVPLGVMAKLGWHARLTQAGAPDANHGRWRLPVVPVDLPDFPHNWFVTAVRE